MIKVSILFVVLISFVKAHSIGWKPQPDNLPTDLLLSSDIIDYINIFAQTTWKAAVTTDRFETISDVNCVLGVVKDIDNFKLPIKKRSFNVIGLPESFDSRDKWPHCRSIKEVRDQSNCGSCWAFGAVEAMTDRYCIHSNGTQNPRISAEDLVSCCGRKCGFGCNGGDPLRAWQYWVDNGIVTGGEYQAHFGCQDYAYPKCSHHVKGIYPKCKNTSPTPQCTKQCQSGYPLTYLQDKHYGKEAYSIENNEKAIMMEIMTNGPVEASFDVFQDFIHYKSGVYQYMIGNHIGGHAVKMIGWGVENNTPYWLLVNSWNPTWGDGGYFKIKRGVNECGIEEGIVAGLPHL